MVLIISVFLVAKGMFGYTKIGMEHIEKDGHDQSIPFHCLILITTH